MLRQSCFRNLVSSLQGTRNHLSHITQVNEIRAERIARNANPLALVAATQHYPDDYTQSPKHYKTQAYSSRQTPSTRTHATTRNKGNEIITLQSLPSELVSEEDSDEEQ
ncbi:hypothetical protein Tco_0876851 [Tanacetum coccineum]|uniref:Uncharacterized protein n=1 Tax=Tanacetum coccineum TaxID=301880 RepID=A0ABQ5BTG3_9ASTR